jgi:hypothetical protein
MGVNFVSLSDSIDTNTAVGKAMFGMMRICRVWKKPYSRVDKGGLFINGMHWS